jgi:uncharacterized protein YjbK
VDVKRIIQELRSERQQIEDEILLLESSEWLDDRTMAFDWDVSSEQKQEHDFCMLLTELRDAVQQQDRIMADYCTGELKRLFREKAATAPRRPQSVAVAKHGT